MSFGFEVPSQLNSDEQARVLRILGLGTSTKFLSNAYPLGGYHGLEVSAGLESINTDEISKYGSGSNDSSTLSFPSISIGKGIYNQSDIFIHFVPPTSDLDVSRFAAAFRWGFYQALFLPINFSLYLHAGIINVDNAITANNLGGDLLLGLSLGSFSFNLGGGWANSSGRFYGGTGGVTLSNSDESHKVESLHFMFGATYNFEPFFIGAAIDRYEDAVFSAKAGFLF